MLTKITTFEGGEIKCREANNNWRGGRHISSHGYIKVLVGTGHRLSDSKGYAYEHRLIAEEKLGRPLHKGELIHHLDGNKQNNEPDNIEVVIGNSGHFLHHRRKHFNLRKPNEQNLMIGCECGCGTMFFKYDSSGRPRKYVSGHNPREGQRGKYKNTVC